jgi:multidrug efflux pump subunit AcrB
MKDIGKWALDNRKLVYFLMVVLVIGGIRSFYSMSKLEDPELRVKQALVVTTYPGASAHEVELEVTGVLERNIRTMNDVDFVESRSMNDVSLIVMLTCDPESAPPLSPWHHSKRHPTTVRSRHSRCVWLWTVVEMNRV